MRGKSDPDIYEVKFHPGPAYDELEKIRKESGLSKNAMLRLLIDSYSFPDESGFKRLAEYQEGFVEIGKEIVNASRFGKWERFLDLAGKASSLKERMTKDEVVAGLMKGGKRLPSVFGKVGRRRFTFRPELAQCKKLSALAMMGGIGKGAVLRCLIFNIRIPCEIGFRTLSRVSQTGGLIKHIAWGNKDRKDWRKSLAAGQALCDFALKGLTEQCARERESVILENSR